MLQSMTGFATKTITIASLRGDQAYVTLSLKSLNSRFFETTFKSPQPFSYLETTIIKLLKKKLVRGHVYLTLSCSSSDLFQGEIQPNIATAQVYVDALKKIKSECHLDSPITLDHLVRISGIFGIQEVALQPQAEEAILVAIDQVIEMIVTARNQEGELLYKDIYHRAQILERFIDEIVSRSSLVVENQKNKMTQALQALEVEDSPLIESQKTALYIALDKMDIQEEITRFKSHLSNLNKQLSSQEIEKGKRIDFIMQEMNREINTIAAKCADTEIGTTAINIKVELEKIREQIQNIV